MRNLLAFCLLATPFFAAAQIPAGRYFNEIKGTAWICSHAGDSGIHQLQFGLTILEIPVDSLNFDATIYYFDDSLSIRNYDSATGELTEVKTIAYFKNDSERMIHFTPPGMETKGYEYLSTSSGAYISFTREKVKLEKRRESSLRH